MLFRSANDVYFVTVIKGRVTKADKAPLKVGEKLHYRDKVIFSGKDDMVVLLHPEKGRFVVTPDATPQDASGGFFVFLNDNLHLQSHRVSLSSRGDHKEKRKVVDCPDQICIRGIVFGG